MNFEDLKNPELQEKLKACSTEEDLVELVKSQGVELSDEQLEGIAGGTKIWGACQEQDHCNPT